MYDTPLILRRQTWSKDAAGNISDTDRDRTARFRETHRFRDALIG